MINYNGKFLNSNSNTVKFNNRALNYGDGIFETIIYHNEDMALLELHWERLLEGAEMLKINLPFDLDHLQKNILELLKTNDLLKKRARIKLIVWRAPGGLYTPESSDSHFLITASTSARKPFKQFKNVLTSQTVFLQASQFSHLKTISALPYVLAGLEKKERGAEELILTDKEGNIAEASASNIFIYSAQKETFYTPPLSCGGINGVSRRFILKEMEQNGIAYQEVKMKVSDLNEQTAVFTTNVSGINQILVLDGVELHMGEKAFYILNNLFPFNH
ncbi:aminotransferase class IV [Marivirga aurantiaca]|nr:aminotransferase class IV [Marivirga aurantiaca]